MQSTRQRLPANLLTRLITADNRIQRLSASQPCRPPWYMGALSRPFGNRQQIHSLLHENVITTRHINFMPVSIKEDLQKMNQHLAKLTRTDHWICAHYNAPTWSNTRHMHPYEAIGWLECSQGITPAALWITAYKGAHRVRPASLWGMQRLVLNKQPSTAPPINT